MNFRILKVIFLILFMKGVTSTLFAQRVKTGLTRSPDVIIKPVTGSADFGAILACGDINGDGFDDIVIGQPRYDIYYTPEDGDVFVIYGGGNLSGTFDLSIESSGWTEIVGQENKDVGSSLCVGDVNRDGFDDILIGASYSTVEGLYERGIVFLIYGREGGLGRRLILFESVPDLMILGRSQGDHLGESLTMGDVNGDGRVDLLMGAPSMQRDFIITGGVFIALNSIEGFPSVLDLSASMENVIEIWGRGANDRCGFSIACKDVDNDNMDDFLIGAYKANSVKRDEGEAYLIYGRSNLPGVIDLLTFNEYDLFAGRDFPEHMGFAVSIGDFNGDELPDLVFGSQQARNGSMELAGRVRIQFGRGVHFGDVDFNDVIPDVSIEGGIPYGQFGSAVAVGDLNGDGFDDLIAGSPVPLIMHAIEPGNVFVFTGRPDWPETRDLDSDTADFAISGDQPGDWFGTALSSGDINGDGFDDILIGATLADSTGLVYVVYGSQETDVLHYGGESIPASLVLDSNYPNPFNAGTVIPFSIPEIGDGTHGAVVRSSLDILNINGQSVRVWDLTGYGPGQYELKWDGRNGYNDPLPSGVYFCRLRYGNEVTIGKMSLIR